MREKYVLPQATFRQLGALSCYFIILASSLSPPEQDDFMPTEDQTCRVCSPLLASSSSIDTHIPLHDNGLSWG